MLTAPGQVRDEGGEYLFSDQAFAGGVESSTGCAVSAFQFKGHDKFEIEGFTGKKSYFFFNDKVLCLGTNISSDLADYDVETTLFQTVLKDTSEKIITSAYGSVSEFPFAKKAKNTWAIDDRGTGFFTLGGTEITISKSTQTNPQFQNKGEVSGNFASAWINHGKAPKDASYQYILMAYATSEKMETFTARMKRRKPAVEIIQKDENAHVVKINEIGAMAYAVYKKEGLSFSKGDVLSVNKQSTFIVKNENGKIRLSVADPDLNIYDGQDDLLPDGSRCELSVYEREWFYWPSRPNKVQITLKGQWQIEKQVKEMETAKMKNAKILSSDKNQTLIEFECKDGLSAEVLLAK